ncbi:hypothetical protein LRR81_02735 [Metabacillus sp. GX 13764]|uniref:competence type IV pilus minor pilin ComGG n=1 Tax=Metabacillus kandeliae TaxID=2900151 RepID=UPI001E53F550|nr:competence type IV pilus minor pilin ComGG [Metabacillus kandeliae]MCD7033130.1 hypothetical protein [Metabacillus kandeliae]
MNNQKGSIFPFTAMMSMLVFLTILHVTALHLLEKNFYFDTKQYYVLDSLMQRGVAQSLKKIKTAPEALVEEEVLKTGKVRYHITQISPGEYKTDIACETNESRKKQAYYIYSNAKGLITSWTE